MWVYGWNHLQSLDGLNDKELTLKKKLYFSGASVKNV